jgi:hypothetical protein
MKTLKIRVANADLNALEDLLYCVLNKRQERDAHKRACKLWNRLVSAWDEPLKTS